MGQCLEDARPTGIFKALPSRAACEGRALRP
jgi:hypothetical protein